MKTIRAIILTAILLVLAAAFSWQQNNSLVVDRMQVVSTSLPHDFDGLRIVHLADLHSKSFGDNQEALVSKIRPLRPDIIVFTGDIIDRRNYRESPALELVDQLVDLAPVYFVTGNQEFWSGTFPSFEKRLTQHGVTVLRNESKRLSRAESDITIAGIDDPSITFDTSDEPSLIPSELNQALAGTKQSGFKLLLAHRPDLLSMYSGSGADIVFSGHAHGGQVRLPFIGGLAAPDQGLFPKYTAGKYREGRTTMIVNRGLGNSIIPQRLFNRPEIGLITLERP